MEAEQTGTPGRTFRPLGSAAAVKQHRVIHHTEWFEPVDFTRDDAHLLLSFTPSVEEDPPSPPADAEVAGVWLRDGTYRGWKRWVHQSGHYWLRRRRSHSDWRIVTQRTDEGSFGYRPYVVTLFACQAAPGYAIDASDPTSQHHVWHRATAARYGDGGGSDGEKGGGQAASAMRMYKSLCSSVGLVLTPVPALADGRSGHEGRTEEDSALEDDDDTNDSDYADEFPNDDEDDSDFDPEAIEAIEASEKSAGGWEVYRDGDSDEEAAQCLGRVLVD